MGSLGVFIYALGKIKYSNGQNVWILAELTYLMNMVKDLVGSISSLNNLTLDKRN